MTDDGILYAFADASVRDGLVGPGYVIVRHDRDGELKLVEAAHRLLSADEQPHDYTIQHAEYRACISAARAAIEYLDSALYVYNDNKQVVKAVNRRERICDDGYF